MKTSSEINAALLPASQSVAPDILKMLLADKRSENTRRAYRHDLRAFFLAQYQCEPTEAIVQQFLALTTPRMTEQILRYKARLLEEGRAEATVNRRLSAILSLVKFARRVGATDANPKDSVDMEKTRPYRDTRGITLEQARALLASLDSSTPKGRRDYALLLVLLENALRRAEIVGLNRADFDADRRTLSILGKGRGTQKQSVTLSPVAAAALCASIADREPLEANAPLFINYGRGSYGKRLTADGLYKIIRETSAKINLSIPLSPHRLRHTAITLALDASAGDIRRVQRLSRHARLETLQIYDDNRSDLQGEMTNALSALLARENADEKS